MEIRHPPRMINSTTAQCIPTHICLHIFWHFCFCEQQVFVAIILISVAPALWISLLKDLRQHNTYAHNPVSRLLISPLALPSLLFSTRYTENRTLPAIMFWLPLRHHSTTIVIDCHPWHHTVPSTWPPSPRMVTWPLSRAWLDIEPVFQLASLTRLFVCVCGVEEFWWATLHSLGC